MVLLKYRFNHALYLTVIAVIYNDHCTTDRSLFIPLIQVHEQLQPLQLCQLSMSKDFYSTMIGTRSALSQVLLDLEKKRELFFIFPDLSVKIPGRFTLKFFLMDIQWQVLFAIFFTYNLNLTLMKSYCSTINPFFPFFIS